MVAYAKMQVQGKIARLRRRCLGQVKDDDRVGRSTIYTDKDGQRPRSQVEECLIHLRPRDNPTVKEGRKDATMAHEK